MHRALRSKKIMTGRTTRSRIGKPVHCCLFTQIKHETKRIKRTHTARIFNGTLAVQQFHAFCTVCLDLSLAEFCKRSRESPYSAEKLGMKLEVNSAVLIQVTKQTKASLCLQSPNNSSLLIEFKALLNPDIHSSSLFARYSTAQSSHCACFHSQLSAWRSTQFA